MKKAYKLRVIVTACSLALASMSGLAAAQSSAAQSGSSGSSQSGSSDSSTKVIPVIPAIPVEPASKSPPESSGSSGASGSTSGSSSGGMSSAQKSQGAKDAKEQVSEATKVVKKMENEPGMKKILEQAQGIFIVPDYGRAALGIGGSGGEGVVLVKQNGQWSNPAFYNTGGISGGLQAGAEGGSIAMVLNNQKAVEKFMQDNQWSLDADAGLTVANWSEKTQATAGEKDVVVWSDTKGLLGDVALSVTNINFDEEDTQKFYGQKMAQKEVFSGKGEAPPQVADLKQALPGGSGATSSGSSGASGATGSSGSSGAKPDASGTSGSSTTVVPVVPVIPVEPASKPESGSSTGSSSSK